MVATVPQSGPSGVLHDSRRNKSDEEGVMPEPGLEVKRAVRSTKRQEGGPITPLLSPEVMARATAQTRFGDPADRPEGEQNRAAVQGVII